MLNLPGLKRVQLPVAGGVDEVAASDSLAPEDAVLMHNFRLSKDGKRIEKRLGIAEEASFGEDIYGYTTYYDTSTPSNFCQLAVLESAIYNKVASGAWTNKHTFSSSMTHPVNIIEIQGKKFVINETDSRMIHYDGNCYQIGITEPTDIPTLTASYYDTASMPLYEDFDYANESALNAVWTDADLAMGVSTVSSTDPGGVQGPEGDSKYMKLSATWALPVGYASRYITTSTDIGAKYSFEIGLYLDNVGTATGQSFMASVTDTNFTIFFKWQSDGFYINTGSDYTLVTSSVAMDTWQRWKFVVDGTSSSSATIDTYIDDSYIGQTIAYATSTGNENKIYVAIANRGGSFAETIAYIDYMRIGSTSATTPVLTGVYRYAVTYGRGGNYGCESNPIKCKIGADTFTGSGLDDLTVSGTYTATENKTFVVKIYSTGTPDVIQWSEDGGVTWSARVAMSSTMYLSYGIILVWGATTGHTINEYWTFTASASAISTAGQMVTIASIPTSADSQVTYRKIYRTTSGGSTFYFLATINDNTTTTFLDNIPDSGLGELMEEDHYVCPNGKFACWWDDRLWVFDHEECLAYYSRIGEPEHFDTVNGWVAIRRGIPGDNITGVIPYKDAIYVFKPNSIFTIQKNQILYGVFQVNNDVGCVSPSTLIEVNDYLMFRSYRGIEVYDGSSAYHFDFSIPIQRTLSTIINLYNDLVCAAHNKEYNEVWFSINDRTSGNEIVIVWNYLKNKWYTFGFSTAISCFSVCRDSSKKNVLKLGTRSGYLCLCDSGYLDMATAISASYRKGWLDLEKHGILRRVDVEYELETGKTLTANVYVDMDKDVFRTYPLTGSSPTTTDAEYRRPIIEKFEVGGRAKWFSIGFENAEQLTGPLKVNDCFMYVRQDVHKNKKYAD